MRLEDTRPTGLLKRVRRFLVSLLIGNHDNPSPTTHPDHLHFLNRSGFELIALPDEDSVYTYIGNTLHRLLDGEVIVVVNRLSPKGKEFIVQGIYGIDDTQLGKALNLLGYSPVGTRFRIDSFATPLFKRGDLVHFEGGLVSLARQAVPPVVTGQLVKLFNLGEIYLIGLRTDDAFYAGVQLYMRGERTIANPEVIEAFIQQASTAIQRLQALNAMMDSEVRYRSLFEQSNDAVFILDLQGKHLRVNQRATEMLGYPLTEMIDLSYRDLVVSEEHHDSDKVLERMLGGEVIPPYERTFRHKDGRLIPAEVNVGLVRDDDGNPIQIQSIIRDISTRKRMEQKLTEKYVELDRFFTIALDLLCIANTDGYFLKLNKAWQGILGYPVEELEGRLFLDFVHPDDLQPTLDAMAQLDRQEEVMNFTNRYRAHDGSYRFIEWRSRPYGKRIYAAARDITERKQMENAVKANEERLQTIVDSIPIMIGFFDQTGRFEFVNRHWVEKLGWTAAELAQQDDPLAVFYPDPDTRQAALDFMLSATPGWRDFETLTKSGKTLTTSWANVRLSNGRTIGIGQDVTDIRQAQERKIELVLEKERRRLLTTFFQNAAHEFRNPLATISSGAYLMSRSDDPERRQHKARQIETSVRRITRLVDSLLLMTELEGDETHADTPINFGELLRDACERISRHYTHEIRCDIQPDLPLILGNADHLSEAIYQIFDNACRYTPEDGVIFVSVRARHDHLWVEVQDSGPGIPEDMLPRIFETFWRQDVAHSTPGFGLGLTIAQRVIERQGGDIDVDSQEGQGTIVRLKLPTYLLL